MNGANKILSDPETYKKYSGKYIAIYEGKIIKLKFYFLYYIYK